MLYMGKIITNAIMGKMLLLSKTKFADLASLRNK
tara:strand:+ start:563 stop:664 length:102 start_codon:yes stop_codon:yes gene_type:complete